MCLFYMARILSTSDLSGIEGMAPRFVVTRYAAALENRSISVRSLSVRP